MVECREVECRGREAGVREGIPMVAIGFKTSSSLAGGDREEERWEEERCLALDWEL
jgi:hypothetical protein